MAKKLIVCADGTWNTQNETDKGRPSATNVFKVARALLPNHTDAKSGQLTPQIVHYITGVGTAFGERVSGGAFGVGLFANVLDCYRFLVLNYDPGDAAQGIAADELYLFGFSRGAFTVRSLAGMIRNSGILRRGHEEAENTAVELYRDYSEKTAPDADLAVEFRKEHSYSPEIEFIGVWDTVGALGIPGMGEHLRLPRGLDWQFHDVTLSSKVHNAYQALAIHEHRAEFEPTLWEQQDSAQGTQKLEQRWFSGAHSDCGGGYPEAGLSDLALKWMIENAENCGLDFDQELIGRPPHWAGDALSVGHDSFSNFYRLLDLLRWKPGGKLRVWDPTRKGTEQAIDE
ncbi:MAG: DUF2235 domain-containing protein, partial [Rhodanobacteraceae bacterium]